MGICGLRITLGRTLLKWRRRRPATCSSAPNICSLKPWRPTHMGRCLQAQHSRPWLARLAAMPEVLPVQFMQMLCSYGVKLCLDLTVADKCDGKHTQYCANDPYPEEPTSPVQSVPLHRPTIYRSAGHHCDSL